LASVSYLGTVRLWDVATGRPIGKALHTGAVGLVAFSPDSKTLASVSFKGRIRLWDMATGRQIGHLFTGHNGPVDSVAFSADGKTLATGGDNGTVRLGDVADQETSTPLTSDEDAVI